MQPHFIQLLVDPLHHGSYIEMVHKSCLPGEDASSDDVICPSPPVRAIPFVLVLTIASISR